jgi:HK97 family phage major capsid protein
LWSPTIGDVAWKLVAAGDTTNARIMSNGRGGDFLGWPVKEASTMATATTTGQKIVVAGDFKASYRIIDRIGTSVELIQNLMGATGYPTGQRGLYAFWRNSAVVQAPNALRYLVTR